MLQGFKKAQDKFNKALEQSCKSKIAEEKALLIKIDILTEGVKNLYIKHKNTGLEVRANQDQNSRLEGTRDALKDEITKDMTKLSLMRNEQVNIRETNKQEVTNLEKEKRDISTFTANKRNELQRAKDNTDKVIEKNNKVLGQITKTNKDKDEKIGLLNTKRNEIQAKQVEYNNSIESQKKKNSDAEKLFRNAKRLAEDVKKKEDILANKITIHEKSKLDLVNTRMKQDDREVAQDLRQKEQDEQQVRVDNQIRLKELK